MRIAPCAYSLDMPFRLCLVTVLTLGKSIRAALSIPLAQGTLLLNSCSGEVHPLLGGCEVRRVVTLLGDDIVCL